VEEVQVGEVRDPTEVSRFVERFAQLLVDAGMPRIASRVFVALIATDTGRLTAAELGDLLRASPAAISGGVRYLTGVGMVIREREPGSRRDHYRVDNDVWYQSISQRESLVMRWTESLREGARAVGEDTPAGVRLAESVEFLDFMLGELRDMTRRWNAYQAGRAPSAHRQAGTSSIAR
jgi:DNA-binding transcriptional regulator GbsR (MarR family)